MSRLSLAQACPCSTPDSIITHPVLILLKPEVSSLKWLGTSHDRAACAPTMMEPFMLQQWSPFLITSSLRDTSLATPTCFCLLRPILSLPLCLETVVRKRCQSPWIWVALLSAIITTLFHWPKDTSQRPPESHKYNHSWSLPIWAGFDSVTWGERVHIQLPGPQLLN